MRFLKISDSTPGEKAWNTKALRYPSDPKVRAYLRAHNVSHDEFVQCLAYVRDGVAFDPPEQSDRVFTKSQTEARKFLVDLLDSERDKLNAASSLIDQILDSIEG